MPETRILIVDDSTFDRRLLVRSFGQVTGGDIEFTEAETAYQAIDILAAQRFEAVFLDINMPGEDGFYVLRHIRDNTPCSWPLVFMYSSSDHPDDIATAYRENATAYLRKPHDLEGMRLMATGCLALIQSASPAVNMAEMSF